MREKLSAVPTDHICQGSSVNARKNRPIHRHSLPLRPGALLTVGIILLNLGCAQLNTPASGLRIYTPIRLRETPWIEREIRAFLGLSPVRKALGFDPLTYNDPIAIHILEERLNERDALRLFGRTDNAQVSIKGYLFPGTAATDDGDILPVNPKVRFDRRVDPHPQRRAMLAQLLADPDLLALYRNLLVAHEVAHVGEWYILKKQGKVVRYTGHGISNRVEMRILAGLLEVGYIDEALFGHTLAFYVQYLNNEAEAPESIAAFGDCRRQSAGGHQAPTQDVP